MHVSPSNKFSDDFKLMLNKTTLDYLYKDSFGNPTHKFMGLINPAYPKMGSELINIFYRNSIDPFVGHPSILRQMEKIYEKKVQQKTSWV